MSRKPNYYTQIINILSELHKAFPSYNLGKHLATAFDGEGDVWGMSDKEMVYVLTKYKTELELDGPHSNDQEIEEIIKQGMNINSLLLEEDEDGESY